MSQLTFDDVPIDVECGHCHRKTAEKVGALKRKPKFTCPHCRQVTDVTIDDRKARRDLDDINRSLKNMFK